MGGLFSDFEQRKTKTEDGQSRLSTVLQSVVLVFPQNIGLERIANDCPFVRQDKKTKIYNRPRPDEGDVRRGVGSNSFQKEVVVVITVCDAGRTTVVIVSVLCHYRRLKINLYYAHRRHCRCTVSYTQLTLPPPNP